MSPLPMGFVATLPPKLRAIRDYLAGGGSVLTAVAVMFVIAGVVLLVVALTRRQECRRRASAPIHDPKKLWTDLLDRLAIDPAHRRFLDAVAADQELNQPAELLLSAASFDQSVAQWRIAASDPGRGVVRTIDDRVIRETRAILFPDP